MTCCRSRQVGVAHAEVDDVGAGVAGLGLGAVHLFEHVRRQAADAVEFFHRSRPWLEPHNGLCRPLRLTSGYPGWLLSRVRLRTRGLAIFGSRGRLLLRRVRPRGFGAVGFLLLLGRGPPAVPFPALNGSLSTSAVLWARTGGMSCTAGNLYRLSLGRAGSTPPARRRGLAGNWSSMPPEAQPPSRAKRRGARPKAFRTGGLKALVPCRN